jgi:hypothetical protein
MQKALLLVLVTLAVASCTATPIHSLDETPQNASSVTIGGGCSSTELTADAKSECFAVKVDFADHAPQESLLSIGADGPADWPAAITVELFDKIGSLCLLNLSKNGTQECGRFIVSDQSIFGVAVTVNPDVPTGVRLSLLTSN